MPAPMTTRRRGNFLRRHGFTKSPFQMTRVGITYKRGDCIMTIPRKCAGGGMFLALDRRRELTLTSSLLFIGNTRSGTAERLRQMNREGYGMPSPDAPDMWTPEWADALFMAWVEAMASAEQRRAESTPPTPAPF